MRRRGKYNAVRTTVENITFASKAEAKRYQELRLLEKVGEIESLRLQPKYALTVNGVHVCDYIADFTYMLKVGPKEWKHTIEDVKGVRTAIYKLKAKLMLALHGCTILET